MQYESVKFRLRAIVVLVITALIIIAFMSNSGMKDTSKALEHLYSQEMANVERAGKVLRLVGDARSSLLLAFQHDPDNKFASMHDHPVELHLDSVMDSLNEVESLVKNEILTSELSSKDKYSVDYLLKELRDITQMGFNQSINEMKKGNYSNANRILLTVINPRFVNINKSATEFLDEQLKKSEESYNNAEENINTIMVELFVLVILSAGIITALAWIILNRISGALNKIQITAEEVSKGDLTQRVQLGGSDELAKLSDYVDEIVMSFQSVINNMNECSMQLATAAEEGTAVASATTQNVMEQQQQTNLVATAIHEFTSTVQEVANNAASAAEASDEAEVATNEGITVLQQTISMINELNEEIAKSSQIIEQLSKQSNEIGSVVDVIDDISEQTNLLALNAAIEAARAGEAGRGFAVVADEVRSLASRTQQSTEEIKTMIQNLQSSSSESMQSMEHGSEQARVTADMAEKAGMALEKIAASVEKINSMNVQIATAAEEQSTVTSEINQNVTSINDISNQTASGAEQSNAASMELAKLMEGMRENVAKFKY